MDSDSGLTEPLSQDSETTATCGLLRHYLIALESMGANCPHSSIRKIKVDLPDFEFTTLKICFTQTLASN